MTGNEKQVYIYIAIGVCLRNVILLLRQVSSGILSQ